MILCPETGFLLCDRQLSLLSTTETRFLIPTVNPNTQKPGFFSGINSYLCYPPKKPGFLSPVNPNTQKPGFFSAINSYLYYPRKKSGFSFTFLKSSVVATQQYYELVAGIAGKKFAKVGGFGR